MLNDEVDRRTRGNNKCYLRRCPKCHIPVVLFRDEQMDIRLDIRLLGVMDELRMVEAGLGTYELVKKYGYATARWRWIMIWNREARTGRRAAIVLPEHRCMKEN